MKKTGKATRQPTHRKDGRHAGRQRATAPGAHRARRRNEVRASWAAAVMAAVLAVGSLTYFLNSDGPPFHGRGAAAANRLYAAFGPIGPALPWLAISALLALVSVAAARGWGSDVTRSSGGA